MPIAKFNFRMDAIKRLYYAKTNHSLFAEQSSDLIEGGILGSNIQK